MVVISAQNATLFNLGQNRRPGVRTSNQTAHVPFLRLRAKVVERKHIWVVNLTTLPFTLSAFHVLIKELAFPDSSLTVSDYVSMRRFRLARLCVLHEPLLLTFQKLSS